MKKILFFTVLSFMLTSCLSDDDNDGPTDASLEGTWRVTSITLGGLYDFDGDGVTSNNLIAETDCYLNETLIFSADNTAISNTTSYAEIIATAVIGSTSEFTYAIDCISELDSYALSWTQDGNTVRILDEGVFTTLTLVGDELILEVPEGFEIFANEDYEIETTEDMTIIYTKQ